MIRPGFLEGAAVALGASVLGSGAAILLAPLVGDPLALRLAVAGVGLGYTLYCLRRARARVGRVSVVGLWAGLTGAVLWLDAPLAVHALVQLAVASLVRILWFHRGPLAALADLGLVAAGLAAGAWAAQHAGSFALALWCVLLVQAAFVAIPASARETAPAPEPDPHAAAFERAHRAAEAAVRRLSVPSRP